MRFWWTFYDLLSDAIHYKCIQEEAESRLTGPLGAGATYLDDIFVEWLALHEWRDVGDRSVHLYGNHFDRDGHSAASKNRRVDDLSVLDMQERSRKTNREGMSQEVSMSSVHRESECVKVVSVLALESQKPWVSFSLRNLSKQYKFWLTGYKDTWTLCVSQRSLTSRSWSSLGKLSKQHKMAKLLFQ